MTIKDPVTVGVLDRELGFADAAHAADAGGDDADRAGGLQHFVQFLQRFVPAQEAFEPRVFDEKRNAPVAAGGRQRL